MTLREQIYRILYYEDGEYKPGKMWSSDEIAEVAAVLPAAGMLEDLPSTVEVLATLWLVCQEGGDADVEHYPHFFGDNDEADDYIESAEGAAYKTWGPEEICLVAFDYVPESILEWDGHSSCRCPECEYRGTVNEFRKDAT